MRGPVLHLWPLEIQRKKGYKRPNGASMKWLVVVGAAALTVALSAVLAGFLFSAGLPTEVILVIGFITGPFASLAALSTYEWLDP